MKNLFNDEIVVEKKISRDALNKIFINVFKGIDEKKLVSMMYSEQEAIFDFEKLCNGENIGQKISMIFNPHRYAIPTKNSMSIIEAFANKNNFLSGLSRAMLFKEGKVKELLYQVLQLGINGIQYVNEFPPKIAQDFYKLYNAKYILDPCAGWGGRMIGAASVGAYYHGFEPAQKTYCGLLKLGEFLKLFETGFDFKIENMPFEDNKLKKQYDFALTSPPYYDTELYSSESTNSCNKYKTFDEWIDCFYIPLIKKTIRHVKFGFVLNIGSRTYNLEQILFNNFKNVKRLKTKLSGKSGLNKDNKTGESFYLIKKG